jgi:hypothetical protein
MRPLCLLWLGLTTLVAAEPTLTLRSPRPDQVWQREDKAGATIMVEGELRSDGADKARLEFRLDGGAWQELAGCWDQWKDGKNFSGTTRIPAGRHELEVRMTGDQATKPSARVRFGVGEVFVVTGQSNSANHGEGRQQATSDEVFTLTPGGEWRRCADPQPGASGNGGSFLPALGDQLHRQLRMPIGFIACGIGATSVREWLPSGIPFPHPPSILSRVRKTADGAWESDGKAYAMLVSRMKSVPAFRAVLWHQGESDAKQKDPTRTLEGEAYARLLTQLIVRSRQDSGRHAPWFVAQVSYHSPADPGSDDLRAAQASLWRSGVALAGPDTDALGGSNRDQGGKGIHFSAQGLKAHAQAWADKVAPWVESRP